MDGKTLSLTSEMEIPRIILSISYTMVGSNVYRIIQPLVYV